MVRHLFHSVVNKNGLVGIRSNNRNIITGLFYRSPNASVKSNNWLETQILRVYTRYYLKVTWETAGQFWQEQATHILTTYATHEGGEETNGNQDEK